MDSVRSPIMTPRKSFARTVMKLLHVRAFTGIAPVDGVQKVESPEKLKDGKNVTESITSRAGLLKTNADEELQREALIAKLFASISYVKAAYAQLQYAQSPYDADGIQAADQLVVSELKKLSELKQCCIKKQFDPSPDSTMLMAEVQELKNLSKTFEITGKKLESQLRLKDSEIMYLREKLGDASKRSKSIEKRLNQTGQFSVLDNLHQSDLNPSHFIAALRNTVKSIRSFVRLMIDEMKSAGWDLDVAVNSVLPDVIYSRADDKCFAFECFVCQGMFDAFRMPSFSLPNVPLPDKKNQRQLFFQKFTELKPAKVKEYLSKNPKSDFAKFCCAKYLQLVHPQMETAFFGNLAQRSLLTSCEFPNTAFFASFAKMAKRVWLLHCLAYSFEAEASIFQVPTGSRFSEVYMECVVQDALLSSEADSPVAFTVVPGFRIGKTVIQCQVYLAQIQNQVEQ